MTCTLTNAHRRLLLQILISSGWGKFSVRGRNIVGHSAARHGRRARLQDLKDAGLIEPFTPPGGSARHVRLTAAGIETANRLIDSRKSLAVSRVGKRPTTAAVHAAAKTRGNPAQQEL